MSINAAPTAADTSPASFVPAGADTATLYRDYADRVCRWATRLTRSPSDAEDIVQEVFLIVHRRGSSWQEISSPGSWLLKVTLNVVRHHWRARGRASKREESWDCQTTGSGPTDPLQTLETQRSMEQLQAAIEGLTDEQFVRSALRVIYAVTEP